MAYTNICPDGKSGINGPCQAEGRGFKSRQDRQMSGSSDSGGVYPSSDDD